MFHYHSNALQSLADELLLKLKKPEKNKKLEQVKRRKAAQRSGTYPGQNRSRKFLDKKKEERRKRARKKPLED